MRKLAIFSFAFAIATILYVMFLPEKLTNIIINQPDSFFVLMRFYRLDIPNCPSEDLLEIMFAHMKRQKSYILSSSMLSSLSSFLLTCQVLCPYRRE